MKKCKFCSDKYQQWGGRIHWAIHGVGTSRARIWNKKELCFGQLLQKTHTIQDPSC